MLKVNFWLALATFPILVACSSGGSNSDDTAIKPRALASEGDSRSTIWDVTNRDLKTTPVKVNRYIWQASLEVLDFMPIETIDPFSGVIVMGYGTPPGGKTKYEATVLVTEPALDARTLRVSLRTPSGPADPETMRALEDAILSRARQLREADAQL
jgi:hypothetical protein